MHPHDLLDIFYNLTDRAKLRTGRLTTDVLVALQDTVLFSTEPGPD